MHCHGRARKAMILISILLSLIATTTAQTNQFQAHAERRLLAKAFVIDGRLAVLRRDADIRSPVLRRLRAGRAVFIIASKRSSSGQPGFFRVAVSRQSRGWIHQAALAVPGRAGEDERVMKLIQNATEGAERIALCNLFLERFKGSALAPRAWLAIGEEADRAASTLTRNARKRLKEVSSETANATIRDYYLNDSGLDRYSRIYVIFDFNDSSIEYTYDGKAYREIVRRFPGSDEARIARARLGRSGKSLAHQK